MPERQRQHAADQRQRGHQDRPQAVAVGLDDRLVARHALRPQVVHVVDLQDRVLLHDAEQHEQSQGREQVQRVAGRPERQERERHGQRQRQQDRERVDDALELRRQDHVHEDHRQRERPQELHERLLEFLAAPADRHGVAGRQVHLGRCASNRGKAVGQGEAGRDVAAHARVALPVQPIHARRAGGLLDGDQVVEANQAAVARGHEQPADRRDVPAIAIAQAQLHVVVVVDRHVAVAGDLVVAADQQAQGCGDVLGVHVEIGGSLTVDLHTQFGTIELERGVGVDDAEVGRLLAQFLGESREVLEHGPLDRDVDFGRAAAEVEGLHVARAAPQIRELAHDLAHLPHHLPLVVVALERLHRLQLQSLLEQPTDREQPFLVRRDADVHLGLVHGAEEAPTHGGQHGAHSANRSYVVLDAPHRVVHRGDAGSLGRVDAAPRIRLRRRRWGRIPA